MSDGENSSAEPPSLPMRGGLVATAKRDQAKFEQTHDGDNCSRDPVRHNKLLAVVAPPRSGSTALYYTLKKAAGPLYGISEPSNPHMFKFRPRDIQDICSPLENGNWEAGPLLNYLVSRGVEIAKFMVGRDPKISDFYPWDISRLVTHSAVSKVVLIYRENLFKQALSMCIATNTQYWHGSKKEHAEAYAGGVGKINLHQFVGCLDALRSINDHILAAKQLTITDHFYGFNKRATMSQDKLYVVKYEDFFETHFEEQSKHWRHLHEFLGFDYSPKILSHEPGHWEVTKINSTRHNGPSTYDTIDNLPDIIESYQAFLQRDAAYLRGMLKERQHLAACPIVISDYRD